MDKIQILKKYFGYDSFREGQELLIDDILKGRDVLGIMPTGAGKSICYQVPALLFSGITIVISPLISLMKDQVQFLNEAGIHAAFINSSLTENQVSKAIGFAEEGRYKIIYVAPERLETYEFLRFAQNADISMVTVDEAHCISQWGQDFRPSYVKIVKFISMLPKRPVVSGFTATATEVVKEDILCILGLYQPRVLVTGFDRGNLYFSVEHVKKKNDYIVRYIKKHMDESGIIYCSTRKNVDMINELLESYGVLVTRYHAGMGQEQRKMSQDDFIYDRKKVIAATNAFGMGIDKSNVRYVIHYNMPQSLENYYQEAGRAGRDGEAAECILLYSPQDIMINRFLIENKEKTPEMEPEDLRALMERDEERLGIMSGYCQTTSCLRAYILNYFGDSAGENCGNCSNCLAEYEEMNVTDIAKKILSCIQECRGRYGINVITGTLRGERRAKLLSYGVDQFESYGICRSTGEDLLKRIIRHLTEENVIFTTKDKYALLKLGNRAKKVAEGSMEINLRFILGDALEKEQKEAPMQKQRKSDILTSKGFELFEYLRKLRAEIAREENMPPYIIFSDKTLVDMCVKLPFHKEEMLNVSGIGENKYQKYGSRFEQAVKDFTGGERENYSFKQSDVKVKPGPRDGRKLEFALLPEIAEQIAFKPRATLSELVEQINSLRDAQTMKRLTNKEIFGWLMSEGFVGEIFRNGIVIKELSEKGKAAGIIAETVMSQKGNPYEVLYYNEEAQKMIVEHLENLGGEIK